MITALRRFAAAVLVAGLAMAAPPAMAQEADAPRTAAEAVEQSIASGRVPLRAGWVVMDVCGSGADRGRGFLNSHENYRDRRSLNAELPVPVRAALTARLGEDPVEALRGKAVRVFGMVRQVRIDWLENGEPTGEFYFQTQMRVLSPDHLVIETGPDGEPLAAACSALAV